MIPTLENATPDTAHYNGVATKSLTGTAHGGQQWTLTVDDGVASRAYSYTAANSDTTLDLIATGLLGDIASHTSGQNTFQYTATLSGHAITITNTPGRAITVAMAVSTAPVTGTLSVDPSSVASHYSSANIVLSGPITPDETWYIRLTRHDDASAPLTVSVKPDTDLLTSLGNAFVTAINAAAQNTFAPAYDQASHILTVTYAAGVKIELLPRTVAAIEGGLATNGMPAARWAHTVLFTGGGADGTSTLGDTWNLTIDGHIYPFSTTADGFANAVGGIASSEYIDLGLYGDDIGGGSYVGVESTWAQSYWWRAHLYHDCSGSPESHPSAGHDTEPDDGLAAPLYVRHHQLGWNAGCH